MSGERGGEVGRRLDHPRLVVDDDLDVELLAADEPGVAAVLLAQRDEVLPPIEAIELRYEYPLSVT